MKERNQQFQLPVELDPQSGQLLSVHDPELDVEILRCGRGAELEWNDQPLRTRLVDVQQSDGEHITLLEACHNSAYGVGWRLRIRRVLTVGGAGVHPGPERSLHLRYEIRRVPHTEPGETLDYIWQPALEAPLRLDHVTVLAAPALGWGAETRFRALALGGSGPREHVGLEEGTIAEIAPYLQTAFRSTFPGQLTINGWLAYHAGDERFVWTVVRRPPTGGRVVMNAQRQAFRFDYFMDFGLQQEITTPAVSWLWGRGLAEADRVLAEQFDRYEEPPDWWFRTAWFWLHPNWQRGGSFATMARGAEILLEECGVTGFGMFVHDVPWSGNDCDVSSPQPSPRLGGDAALRRAVEQIRAGGGHTYVWMSRHGHRQDALGWRESWAIRGVDGRPIRIYNRPDSGVRLDIINCADPTFFDYITGWIRYYVEQLGVTGVFWDSGMQPLPPDFGAKPYLRWPGETTARALDFYERVYRFGRSLNRDFFMWVEGINTDVPMNAFAVDGRGHGGHRLLQRIAHAGPKRLVWRSAWPHDLASGFPFIAPFNDIGWVADEKTYRKVAAEPMNRWICRVLKERGCRHAVGLGDGLSRLDEFVIAAPGVTGTVTVPGEHRALQHVISGAKVTGRATAGGTVFELPESGAYELK